MSEITRTLSPVAGQSQLRKRTEYTVWMSMRTRCKNPNSKSYHNYGGRGIKVCELWNDFETFLVDVGPRPSPSHTLDRFPNPNGDYEPGNVRWATRVEQARNTRANRFVTIRGETKTAAEWAGIYRIKYTTAITRMDLLGWDAEQAFARPLLTRAEYCKPSRGEAHGRAKLTAESVRAIRASGESGRVLAKRYGVSRSSIQNAKRRKTWPHVA